MSRKRMGRVSMGCVVGRVVLGAVPLLATLALFLPAANAQPATRRLSADEYFDKVLGGWLGKNIGVLYGEPNEFALRWKKADKEWQVWHKDHREDLEIGAWLHRVPDGAHDQDDIYINLIYLEVLEKYGLGFTGEQVAERWLANRPNVWCANKAALYNMTYGIWPPLSGHPAFSKNITDIDAQIECDVWGMIAPGMISSCAHIARTGAHVTNFGDGAYAAITIACLYSEAFFEPDMKKCIQAALKTVPADSLYAGLARDCIEWHGRFPDWRDARAALAEKYEKLGGIHAALNSGAVLLGLLYGDGDYDKTLFVSTMCGWDSDCNPSTAAGILGTAIGASKTPAKWKDPLKDIYKGHTVKAYAPAIKITELARKTVAIGEKVIAANGGRIVAEGDRKHYEIPIQPPTPVAAEVVSPEEIAKIRSDVVQQAMRELAGAEPARQALAIRRILRVAQEPLAQVDRTLVTPDAVEKVAGLLGSGDATVAANAALMLGALSDKRALEGLVKAAEDPRGDPALGPVALGPVALGAVPLRAEAVKALQPFNREPGIAAKIVAIVKATSDDPKTSDIACAAVEALRGAGEAELSSAVEAIKAMPETARKRVAKSLPEMAKGAPHGVARELGMLMTRTYREWDPAWAVVCCGTDMNPGVRAEYLDKKNVLMTHPLDRQTPCSLVREAALAPDKEHSLEVVVCAHDVKDADWELRVLVNGECIAKQTIAPVDGKAQWQTLAFDLSKSAGKKIKIELQNAANGWAWEAGYWASAKIVSR